MKRQNKIQSSKRCQSPPGSINPGSVRQREAHWWTDIHGIFRNGPLSQIPRCVCSCICHTPIQAQHLKPRLYERWAPLLWAWTVKCRQMPWICKASSGLGREGRQSRRPHLQTIPAAPCRATKRSRTASCKESPPNHRLDYKNLPLEMTFVTDSYEDINYMQNIFKGKYGGSDSSWEKGAFWSSEALSCLTAAPRR